MKAFFGNLSLPSVFKSKRFLAAYASFVVMIGVGFVPELAPHAAQLQASVLAITLTLVTTYGIQDARSASLRPTKYDVPQEPSV